MPVDGCLNAPGLTVDVTITRSPHTFGDDQPRPGTPTLHATFFSADQLTGRLSMSATPRPDAPRNCGHTVSAGATGAGSAIAAASSAIAISTRISAVYSRVHGRQHPRCTRPNAIVDSWSRLLSVLFAFGNEAAR